MTNLESLLSCNLKSELASRGILDFVRYIKKDYIVNWHHELLCRYLDAFVKGEISRLMVFMPPQHGKSELVSRMLPAFILGKNPRAKVTIASYSDTLSTSFNRDCQRYIDSEAYKEVFPNTYLNGSNISTMSRGWLRNSDIFETVGFGGFLKTVGVGGALTGTPVDFGIIDDPVKDSMEAGSATYQQRNIEWYDNVFSTRLHNQSSVLITQTRWDENDLSGAILKKEALDSKSKWVILCLPAIKENDDNEDDPRSIGEALWEEKHSRDRIMDIQKKSIKTFESLYQQNPKPVQAGGEFYKKFTIMRNVKTTEYDPSLAVHLTFDFNVRPAMHASAWQIKKVGTVKIAMKIKEFISKSPYNNTKGICDEFKRWKPIHTSGLSVYGDPSGHNEDTRSEKGFNDYTIIMNELKLYHPSKRVASSHPSVAGRGDFINSVFEGAIDNLEFVIGDMCLKSIEDYLYIKEDSDRTKLKAKVSDPETGKQHEKYGHLSDGDDYFFCMAFSQEYARYQAGDAPMVARVGRNMESRNRW